MRGVDREGRRDELSGTLIDPGGEEVTSSLSAPLLAGFQLQFVEGTGSKHVRLQHDPLATELELATCRLSSFDLEYFIFVIYIYVYI